MMRIKREYTPKPIPKASKGEKIQKEVENSGSKVSKKVSKIRKNKFENN
jgi:hypothetical protein